jgi:hypothetical protein
MVTCRVRSVPTLCYLVLVLGMLLLSCSDSTEPENGDSGPTEDLGELIAGCGMNPHWLSLTWSTSTDELLTVGYHGINAIDLQSLDVRTILQTDGVDTPQATKMVLSNDGNTIYYTLAGPGSHGPLYSISLNGQNCQLLDSRECASMCISPDDARVAYCTDDPTVSGTDDSLYVYDVAAGERDFLCIGRPSMFSQDGASLLYFRWTHADTGQMVTRDYYTIDLESGICEMVSFGVEMFRFLDLHWDESGMYVLCEDQSFDICVHNVTAADTVFCWQVGLAYRPSFSFSPEGNKIGYWVSICGWFGPPCTYYMYVVDLNSQTETCIAFAKDRKLETFAFSPDETRIAYVFGQGIYVDDLP